MIRISRVSMPKLSLEYGWLFDIQTVEELEDYLQEVVTSRAKEQISDALKYAQGLGHANIIAQRASMRGTDIVTAATIFNHDVWDAMHSLLHDQKQIFVNGVGGYFGKTDDVVVHDTKKVGAWLLPGDNVRIIQWPDGKHFYAKIGQLDVELDGCSKWDTRVEAEQAAQKFIKRKRR